MCEERMECITAKSMATSMAQTQGKLAKSSPQVRLREMAKSSSGPGVNVGSLCKMSNCSSFPGDICSQGLPIRADLYRDS